MWMTPAATGAGAAGARFALGCCVRRAVAGDGAGWAARCAGTLQISMISAMSASVKFHAPPIFRAGIALSRASRLRVDALQVPPMMAAASAAVRNSGDPAFVTTAEYSRLQQVQAGTWQVKCQDRHVKPENPL